MDMALLQSTLTTSILATSTSPSQARDSARTRTAHQTTNTHMPPAGHSLRTSDSTPTMDSCLKPPKMPAKQTSWLKVSTLEAKHSPLSHALRPEWTETKACSEWPSQRG